MYPTLHRAPRHVSARAYSHGITVHPSFDSLSFKWVYLVVTYDGVIVRMFVNAELVAQVHGRIFESAVL